MAVLLLDLAKGFAAAEFGRMVGGGDFSTAAVGLLAAILGHNYPVWLRFKGGRGLAPAAGGMLAIAWMVVPAWCLLWGIAYFLLRSVNPASAVASAAVAACAILLPPDVAGVVSGGEETTLFRLFVLLVMCVVLVRLIGEVKEFIAERRKGRAAEIGR